MTVVAKKRWTGPREGEIDGLGRLRATVPPERWPYGTPDLHEGDCRLKRGGLWCDCAASDESADEYGASA